MALIVSYELPFDAEAKIWVRCTTCMVGVERDLSRSIDAKRGTIDGEVRSILTVLATVEGCGHAKQALLKERA